MALLKLLWPKGSVGLEIKMAVGYPLSEVEMALVAVLTQGLIPVQRVGVALQLLCIRFIARPLVVTKS